MSFNWRTWLTETFRTHQSTVRRRQAPRFFRPQPLLLEDRVMPATSLTLGFDPAVSFAKGSASALLPFTASDTTFAGTTLTVTATSDNPTLIPNDASHLSLFGQNVGNGQGRSLLITPASASVSGTANILLTVDNG